MRFPSQVRALVAHEPPLQQLTTEAQRQTARLPELYRQHGMAALRVFAASIGADQGDAAPAGPGSPATVGNAKYFLEYDAPAVARYHLDITTLSRSPARVVVAAGQASRQYFPYQCAAALASLLGTDLVEFPGGHGAYAGNDPQAFGSVLQDVLLEAGNHPHDRAGRC